MSATDAFPVACVPGAIAREDRAPHAELSERLFGGARETVRLEEGYAFRFDAAALGDVARFVDNERRCCPFLTFTIEQHPGEGPVWLRMTGPEGTGALLASGLPV